MNFKNKRSVKIVSLLKVEPTCHQVAKGHQIVVHLDSSQSSSVDGTRLANHKAKESNNPQNNSGLYRYVIPFHKTSAVYMKIVISRTDYYHRGRKTHLHV